MIIRWWEERLPLLVSFTLAFLIDELLLYLLDLGGVVLALAQDLLLLLAWLKRVRRTLVEHHKDVLFEGHPPRLDRLLECDAVCHFNF